MSAKQHDAGTAARSAALKVPGVSGVPALLDFNKLHKPAALKQYLIGPEEAAEILKTLNHVNRPLRRGHSEHLQEVINSGQWRADHPAPIIFDTDGFLQDGQHRLTAVRDSRNYIVIGVVTGSDKDLRAYLDTGASRSLNDRLKFLEDEKQNKIAASMLTQWYITLSKVSKKGVRITPADAMERWEEHKDSVTFISGIVASRRKLPSEPPWRRTACLVALALMYESGPKKAKAFIEDFTNPMPTHSVSRAFREFLFRFPYSGGWDGVRKLYEHTLFAVGAYLRNEDVSSIKRATIL